MGYERNDRGYGRGGYGHDRDRGSRGYGAGRGGHEPSRGHYRDNEYERGDWLRSDDRGGRDRDDDRGFFERAGDEVRSWFGDEEAERRREADERHERHYGSRDRHDSRYSPRAGWSDEDRGRFGRPPEGGRGGQGGGERFRDDTRTHDWGDQSGRSRTSGHHDESYRSWRDRQMAELDRDYDEYRRENQSRFESEFGAWRQTRQQQRQHLGKVREHMEVVGADGTHIGTVDHVRGDRILLTKTDKDAGNHHHSIPCGWIQSVEDKVTLAKSAEEARRAWRDEESRGGLFGGDRNAGDQGRDRGDQAGVGANGAPGATEARTNLNSSFPGTY